METARTYMTTIADAYGNTEQEFSYGSVAVAEPVEASDRGYTGHEHITLFGLINMNGRCYDPVMSSFLSVDRYVQNPSSSQNFNRYSYCLNNPLKYTDPSGWQMSDPYTPYAPVWGLGCHVGLEPRDFRDGSAFMTSWTLFGGGDGSLSAGGGGGGSSAVSYGFAVNNPQYTVEQQCSLIRNWQKNPSWINKWMMQKAGLSDINRGEVYVNGIRSTYLSWEYNGMSHTASIENEYVGGRGLWCQTVSDMGGRGRYVPPGYKGAMPDGTTTFNRTYETIGTDPGVLRGIGDGIRSLTLAAVDFEKASKTVKVLGKGITHASYLGDAISLEIAWHNYRVNRTYENKARLIVTAIGIGVNGLDFFVPGLGTVCSIAVFAIDADGGFDNFYYKYGRE